MHIKTLWALMKTNSPLSSQFAKTAQVNEIFFLNKNFHYCFPPSDYHKAIFTEKQSDFASKSEVRVHSHCVKAKAKLSLIYASILCEQHIKFSKNLSGSCVRLVLLSVTSLKLSFKMKAYIFFD